MTKCNQFLDKRYSDAMVRKSVSWVHVYIVQLGMMVDAIWSFYKHLEVSKCSINVIKAPQMVTMGIISCCGGIAGATGPGWLV